jgi:hypothetical protein
MALYPLLKMIHSATVKNQTSSQDLLAQNVYYIIPTINVDGLVYIDEMF